MRLLPLSSHIRYKNPQDATSYAIVELFFLSPIYLIAVVYIVRGVHDRFEFPLIHEVLYFVTFTMYFMLLGIYTRYVNKHTP